MSQENYNSESTPQQKQAFQPKATTLHGDFDGTRMKIAIVAARFNSMITEKLLNGAFSTLIKQGVDPGDITVAWVPGAFELPMVCHTMATSKQYNAVIALGCVIRGETTHYDYVCQQAAQGILQAGIASGLPVIFGVVTTENIEQAQARAGNDKNNKGLESALAAIEMANLMGQLDRQLIF